VVQKSSQIIVLRHQDRLLGLLVDALHGVTEFRTDQVIPTPFGGSAGRPALVEAFIKANGGECAGAGGGCESLLRARVRLGCSDTARAGRPWA